jgi:hypothetical protein
MAGWGWRVVTVMAPATKGQRHGEDELVHGDLLRFGQQLLQLVGSGMAGWGWRVS